MEIKKNTTMEKTEEYELSTEDIEEIIKDRLKLRGDIQFKWDIGQWISLVIIAKNKDQQEEIIRWGQDT